MACGASPHRGPSRARISGNGTPPGPARPNGLIMNQSEFRNYHEREAARMRSLLATATTSALKARLLKEAENHEQLAEEFEDLIEASVA
jgi:hypothetical protein